MKRRKALKGLTIAAGGSLRPSTACSLFALGQDKEINQHLAVPIRGLVKKHGRLLQPVLIHLQHSRPNATVVTKLKGLEADSRTLSEVPHTFQVFGIPCSC